MLEVWENKGDLPRSVPMTRRVAELVAARMHGPTLFHDVPVWKVGEVWRQVRDDLGLSDDKQLVPHACRHTCASRLVQRGASLYGAEGAGPQQHQRHRALQPPQPGGFDQHHCIART